MKTRRKVWLAIAAMALLAGLCWLFWPESGPRDKGEPVSFWFRQYYLVTLGHDADRTPEQVDEAFEKMGTNALPYLAGQALSTKSDTPFRERFYGLLARLPASLHAPPYVTYMQIRDQAVSAIHDIKPSGPVILPLVEKALQSSNSLQGLQAVRIVCTVEEGKDVLIPHMARLLHSNYRAVRGIALEWVSGLGPDARAAVPDLAKLLAAEDDPADRNAVLSALSAIGSDARAAVPELQKAFAAETNWPARGVIARTLCKIDAEQPAALNYLVATLEKHDVIPASRSHQAAMLLEQIGENARAAAPALIKCLDANDVELVVLAAGALRNIGESNALIIAKLEARLKNGAEADRLEIAKSILAAEPSNPSAQTALMEMVKDKSTNRVLAIYALWVATPMAPETVAVLREARTSEDARVRSAAARTLMKVGALEPPK